MEQFTKISLQKGWVYSKLNECGCDPATVAKLGKLISMTEDEFFVEINSNFPAGTCANGVIMCYSICWWPVKMHCKVRDYECAGAKKLLYCLDVLWNTFRIATKINRSWTRMRKMLE